MTALLLSKDAFVQLDSSCRTIDRLDTWADILVTTEDTVHEFLDPCRLPPWYFCISLRNKGGCHFLLTIPISSNLL